LNYLILLIKTHGHYHQFLVAFHINIDLSKKENSNIIPLKILKSLLSKENVNFLNPFIAEHKCPGI